LKILPKDSKLVYASIVGGRVKEITNNGSDHDIRYIYVNLSNKKTL
jgi:hypothetical protein